MIVNVISLLLFVYHYNICIADNDQQLPPAPEQDCNHYGVMPIDYCVEGNFIDGKVSSKSYQCEYVDNKWYLKELSYENSANCSSTGDNIHMGDYKECLASEGCICGETSNDCSKIDDDGSINYGLFYIRNYKQNPDGICDYTEYDAYVIYSYNSEFGADCSETENGYIEKLDTCQRIYCDDPEKEKIIQSQIVPDISRRRLQSKYACLLGLGSCWVNFCIEQTKSGCHSEFSCVGCRCC